MSPALFTALTNALNRFSVQPLKPHNGSFILQTGEQPLLKINESSMKLADKIELNSKLTPTKATQSQTLVEGSKLGEFFQALTPSIVRLNHLGIGYDCPDISEEIDYYKTQLADTWLHLYEEPSDSPYARWLFVGNRTNWQDPLFELVLTQNNWPPQFQIDLDTKLSFEELEALTNKHLRQDFFSWKLDIANYGVVLAMGKLGEVSGTEIYLGLGTNLRNTEMHRRQILKDI